MFCAETIGGFSVGHVPVLHLHSPPLQALVTGHFRQGWEPPHNENRSSLNLERSQSPFRATPRV